MECKTGRTTMAPTVWLINDVKTSMSAQNTARTCHSVKPSTSSEMLWAMLESNPDDLTASPSANPPWQRMVCSHKQDAMSVQIHLLQSHLCQQDDVP